MQSQVVSSAILFLSSDLYVPFVSIEYGSLGVGRGKGYRILWHLVAILAERDRGFFVMVQDFDFWNLWSDGCQEQLLWLILQICELEGFKIANILLCCLDCL